MVPRNTTKMTKETRQLRPTNKTNKFRREGGTKSERTSYQTNKREKTPLQVNKQAYTTPTEPHKPASNYRNNHSQQTNKQEPNDRLPTYPPTHPLTHPPIRQSFLAPHQSKLTSLPCLDVPKYTNTPPPTEHCPPSSDVSRCCGCGCVVTMLAEHSAQLGCF